MILVDTSVWIDHLENHNPALAAQLEWGTIVCHPAVIGELACGRIPDREEILSTLLALPQIMEAQHEEVYALIENHDLMGTGIGWIDAHLLASALLSDVKLWTLDRRLANAASKLQNNH